MSIIRIKGSTEDHQMARASEMALHNMKQANAFRAQVRRTWSSSVVTVKEHIPIRIDNLGLTSRTRMFRGSVLSYEEVIAEIASSLGFSAKMSQLDALGADLLSAELTPVQGLSTKNRAEEIFGALKDEFPKVRVAVGIGRFPKNAGTIYVVVDHRDHAMFGLQKRGTKY